MSKNIHAEICKELNELYIRKNNDYGDSFSKLRNEIPDAILVRIYDKYSRLKTLLRGTEQKVNDESIVDTLTDIANYAILELMELRKEQHGKTYKPGELVPISQDRHIANKEIKGIMQQDKQFTKASWDDVMYLDTVTGEYRKLGLG
jgi:hypothetical protein